MPDSIRTLYELERSFREMARIDTTFAVGVADVTGDENPDHILAIISLQNSDVTLEYCTINNSDTLRISQVPCDTESIWSPFRELRIWYFNAIEWAPRIEFDNPRSMFFIPEIMVRDVSRRSGESEESLRPIVSDYVKQFKGRCIWTGTPDGIYGGSWIWYEPLRQFVLIYTP